MNLQNKGIKSCFIISLILTLFLPCLFPTLNLNYFAPFLVIVFYQKPLPNALWIASGCGLCLDFVSSDTRFGLHALNFCLTSAILYNQKKNFFADSLTTLPVMVFLFSVISTLFYFILYFTFDHPVLFSLSLILTDFVLAPLFDACYAFTLFILPFTLLGPRQKRGKDYFLDKV